MPRTQSSKKSTGNNPTLHFLLSKIAGIIHMKNLFLDPITGLVSATQPTKLDYGMEHFYLDDSSVVSGSVLTDYEPTDNQFPPRTKYLDEYGAVPLLGEMIKKLGGNKAAWPAPSPREFINCLGALRKFLRGSRIERKILLLHKMGFDDSGMSVDVDALYVYKFSTEPAFIQVFLRLNEYGTITEINKIDVSLEQTVKVPVDFFGIQYLFCQVFEDLNRVDFNKVEELDPQFVEIGESLLDLETDIPMVDLIPVASLPRFNDNVNPSSK